MADITKKPSLVGKRFRNTAEPSRIATIIDDDGKELIYTVNQEESMFFTEHARLEQEWTEAFSDDMFKVGQKFVALSVPLLEVEILDCYKASKGYMLIRYKGTSPRSKRNQSPSTTFLQRYRLAPLVEDLPPESRPICLPSVTSIYEKDGRKFSIKTIQKTSVTTFSVTISQVGQRGTTYTLPLTLFTRDYVAIEKEEKVVKALAKIATPAIILPSFGDNDILVATYGTLKQVESNHRVMKAAKGVFVGSAITTQSDFNMVGYNFPIVARGPGGTAQIVCELFKIPTRGDLAPLDQLEGHPTWYRRQLVQFSHASGRLVHAYMYLQKPAQIEGNRENPSRIHKWESSLKDHNHIYWTARKEAVNA